MDALLIKVVSAPVTAAMFLHRCAARRSCRRSSTCRFSGAPGPFIAINTATIVDNAARRCCPAQPPQTHTLPFPRMPHAMLACPPRVEYARAPAAASSPPPMASPYVPRAPSAHPHTLPASPPRSQIGSSLQAHPRRHLTLPPHPPLAAARAALLAPRPERRLGA